MNRRHLVLAPRLKWWPPFERRPVGGPPVAIQTLPSLAALGSLWMLPVALGMLMDDERRPELWQEKY